jgi:hypothetical protein
MQREVQTAGTGALRAAASTAGLQDPFASVQGAGSGTLASAGAGSGLQGSRSTASDVRGEALSTAGQGPMRCTQAAAVSAETRAGALWFAAGSADH